MPEILNTMMESPSLLLSKPFTFRIISFFSSLAFQRDTTGLTAENTELKLRLQAMEQQAQLRDGMFPAL